MSGAIDIEACFSRQSRSLGSQKYGCCKCGRCRVCGHQKHRAVHGPFFGEPPGSKPYGHEFVPTSAGLHQGSGAGPGRGGGT